MRSSIALMTTAIAICLIYATGSSAQIVDISAPGSHSRFVWDTGVSAADTSIATPGNGNSDLIFDQFNNETQWAESWFLQGDFGSGVQNIELLNGVVNNAGDQATVNFNNIENSGIDLELSYLISEGSDGFPFLDINAAVTNSSTSTFNGSLISYFDYHLGTLADDSGQALLSGDQIVTYDNLLPYEQVIRQMEAVSHWEIGGFDVSSVPYTGLYFDLIDPITPKLTLADANTVPGNLENITAAQQWDLNLGVGDQFFVHGYADHNMSNVPEPSSVSILAIGLSAYVCRRRKRKQLV